MRTHLLVLYLCALQLPLFAQNAEEGIRFEKDGRISTALKLPSVYQDSVTLYIRAIPTPGSEFVDPIKKAYDLDSSASVDSAFKEFYHFPRKIFPSFHKSLTDKSVLVYDTLSPYFPVTELPDTLFGVVVDSATQTSGQNATLDLRKGDGKPVTFSIRRQNFDNQIVGNHLKASRKYYKGITAHTTTLLDSLTSAFGPSFSVINRYLYNDSIRNCPPGMDPFLLFQLPVVEFLIELEPGVDLLNSMFCKTIDDNREWIKRWLWLTGGEVRLNPFPRFNPDALIADVDAKIASNEKTLALLGSYTECCQFGRLVYEDAAKKTDSLLTNIDSLKKRKIKLASFAAAYKDWLTRVSISRRFLYKGQIVGSISKHIHWIHNFDASDKFRFVTPPEQLPLLVAPQDEVIALFHNVKYSDSLSLKASEEAYQPKTKLEQVLQPLFGAMKIALPGAAALAGMPNFLAGVFPRKAIPTDVGGEGKLIASMNEAQGKIQVLKEVINTNEEKAAKASFQKQKDVKKEIRNAQQEVGRLQDSLAVYAVEMIDFITYDNRFRIGAMIRPNLRPADRQLLDQLLVPQSRAAFVKMLYALYEITDQKDYEIIVRDFQQAKTRMRWLLEQTIPVLEINLKDETTPDFKTVAEYPEAKLEMSSSKQVKYEEYRNADKEPVVIRSYGKYELARWWPTVGIAYVPSGRSGSVFNDSTGTFVSGNDFDNFEILAGVKFYPWRTNPVRDNATRRLIRGKFSGDSNVSRGNAHISNTAFLTGGFGVRHKFLRNYYLGVGADLTPGLSLLVGINYIFQKRYELENSRIKSQVERPKGFLFFGLSVDPNIVANLVGIFK